MTAAAPLDLSPARQAERILAAWAAGDEPWLHLELQKVQTLRCRAGAALDEEKLELLQALSTQMMQSPHHWGDHRPDPAVRCCLELLAHLAKAPGAPGKFN